MAPSGLARESAYLADVYGNAVTLQRGRIGARRRLYDAVPNGLLGLALIERSEHNFGSALSWRRAPMSAAPLAAYDRLADLSAAGQGLSYISGLTLGLAEPAVAFMASTISGAIRHRVSG